MKIKFEATKSYEIRATGIPAWLLRSLDSGSKTAGVMEDLLGIWSPTMDFLLKSKRPPKAPGQQSLS
jgi:hypothetical protein